MDQYEAGFDVRRNGVTVNIKQLLYRVIPVFAAVAVTVAGSLGPASAATARTSQAAGLPAPSHSLPTLAAAEAYLKAHPATSAEIAAVRAYLAAHPVNLQADYLKTPSTAAPGTVSPNVSVAFQWYGVDVYLTPADTENIWNSILIGGLAAAGTALCAEGGPLAVACGIVGGILGYLIADAVYNYFDWGECGLDFYFYWAGSSPGYGTRYWDCK